MKNKTYRSDLGRVKGHGSAKEGTAHWWGMRISSVALVPLTIWFVVSVISLVGLDRATVQAWLSLPLHAVIMALFIGFSLHHSANGIQTVVEDYVHAPWAKTVILILNKLAHLAAMVAAAYALILIAAKA